MLYRAMGLTRVELLVGARGGRFPFSNCLLVEDGGVKVLVDSGCGRDMLMRVKGIVDYIVYTHHHPDHISGYHIVEGAPCYSPQGEEPYKTIEDLGRRFASTSYREWINMATSLIGLAKVPRCMYYTPGEDLCIRGLCLKTISAPGHLQTHTLIDIDGHLHITDIDLTSFGPWYANPESDPLAFLSDIIMVYHTNFKRLTTSHKDKVYSPDEAREALRSYALKLLETMETVHGSLGEEPLRPEDLAGRGLIYRRYLPGFEAIMRYFETSMIRKILHILDSMGCTTRTRMGYTLRDCSWLETFREKILSRLY